MLLSYQLLHSDLQCGFSAGSAFLTVAFSYICYFDGDKVVKLGYTTAVPLQGYVAFIKFL